MRRSGLWTLFVLLPLALTGCTVGDKAREAAGTVVLGAALLAGGFSSWTYQSSVASNREGEEVKDVALEVHIVPREEVAKGLLAEDETLIAFPSGRLNRSLLLVAVKGLPEKLDKLKKAGVQASSPETLRGWLIVQKRGWGCQDIYGSVPAGFSKEGVIDSPQPGTTRWLSPTKLWTQWWSAAARGEGDKYNVSIAPVTGTIGFLRGKGGAIIEMNLEATIDGSVRFHRGKLTPVKHRELL